MSDVASTAVPKAAYPAGQRVHVLVDGRVDVLDYLIPRKLDGVLMRGSPVRVPLRSRVVAGYVVGCSETTLPQHVEVRDIDGIEEDLETLPGPLIETLLFAADYYGVPAGQMLGMALPPGRRETSVRYVLDEEVQDDALKANEEAVLSVARQFPKGFTAVALERELGWTRRRAIDNLKRLKQRGVLAVVSKRGGRRKVSAYRRCEDVPPERGSLLEHIPTTDPILASQLHKIDSGAYRKLKKLVEEGRVIRVEVEQTVQPYAAARASDKAFTPTAEQQNAIERIVASMAAGGSQPILLQGVTGSGKTEVYMQAIEHALAQGRQALILVPEIALTPQLGRRFRDRFGEQVATFHSGLTAAERRDEWDRVAQGQARIGLGARSALFLPLRDVGIIVVDEEHETSFKQDETPRYNARDLAVVRARFEKAAVVLGSATPSLESRANAQHERFEHVILSKRAKLQALPQVELVDLADVSRSNHSMLSDPMLESLGSTIAKGEQAILFLNRRGFAPYVYCRDCGHAYSCEECSVSLTLHRKKGALVCHYCGEQRAVPDECSECHSHRVEASGLGTEKLESELAAIFDKSKIARMDRDTVRTRRDLERLLARFANRETQILLGTQMVAKGHDFPGVTFVGVVNADASLNFPDFRAAERTFQLLTQVAGRAGRGDLAGRVMVQTYSPEHHAVRFAADQDFESFFAEELKFRQELDYPPFSHLALLRFQSEDRALAWSRAQHVAQAYRDRAQEQGSHSHVLGPADAPLARIKGQYRIQLLVRSPSRRDLREVLRAPVCRVDAGVRQILDVDPLNML